MNHPTILEVRLLCRSYKKGEITLQQLKESVPVWLDIDKPEIQDMMVEEAIEIKGW